MAESLGRRTDWERKEQLAAALVDFLEGWVVRELCVRFRTASEALYKETPEQRLLLALMEEGRPLSLREICAKCDVSREQVMPHGRLRRALDRLESAGMLSKTVVQGEDRPRYSLDRRNLTSKLMVRVFQEKPGESLVAASLRTSFGP